LPHKKGDNSPIFFSSVQPAPKNVKKQWPKLRRMFGYLHFNSHLASVPALQNWVRLRRCFN